MTASKGIHIHLRLEVIKLLRSNPNSTNEELIILGIPVTKHWLNKKLKELKDEGKIYISDYKRTAITGDHARAYSLRLAEEEDELYPEKTPQKDRTHYWRKRAEQKRIMKNEHRSPSKNLA
jgi:hypothetical protein